jgi:hypothetical protein
MIARHWRGWTKPQNGDAFAGADYRTPVFDPEAHVLLSRIEPTANHYEIRANTL